MQFINQSIIKHLKFPAKESHKGENGRLAIIGGSKLFHGSPLLALQVASKIVDMVYFVSVEENLGLVKTLKGNLNSFIAVPYGKEYDYILQADTVLIGPGMVRGNEKYTGTGESGFQTREKVLNLLKQFPDKKWILDAGALQVLKGKDILALNKLILTPHYKEFNNLFISHINHQVSRENTDEKNSVIVTEMAKKYHCTIVLKGKIDIITDGEQTLFNQTGNEGMTKGGTGDVLAGLIASLATTNELFLSALTGAYINGLSGDSLYKTLGPFFNADQLASKVPEVLWSCYSPQKMRE